jgi:CubicO group peptidase (beta-lactamase class C family)
VKFPLTCLWFLTILILFNLATQAQDTQESVASVIQQQVDAGIIEGASHLVVQHGKIIKFEVAGWSDIEDKTPFQQDTIVRIYSMSKPITSVAAMKLWEQGKFQLEDPVSKYLPAFANVKVIETLNGEVKLVAPKREMTVRDVFCHTTGFSYGDEPVVNEYYAREKLRYRGPAQMFPPEMTIAQAAGALARIPALHHPGERFTYGFNTDLLGRLIEIWSGQSLDKYLEASLFKPLEMVDTGFRVPAEKRARFASCYTSCQGRLAVIDKSTTSPFRDGFKFLSGGGGLLSTQADYANFCSMLVNGGAYKGKRILKTETLDLMFEDQLKEIAATDFNFGLGFAINKISLGSGATTRGVLEYTWGGYASTDFHIVPSEKVYQIFMRQFVPAAHDLGHQQIKRAYADLGDPP